MILPSKPAPTIIYGYLWGIYSMNLPILWHKKSSHFLLKPGPWPMQTGGLVNVATPGPTRSWHVATQAGLNKNKGLKRSNQRWLIWLMGNMEINMIFHHQKHHMDLTNRFFEILSLSVQIFFSDVDLLNLVVKLGSKRDHEWWFEMADQTLCDHCRWKPLFLLCGSQDLGNLGGSFQESKGSWLSDIIYGPSMLDM